jgi:hypothetical protein
MKRSYGCITLIFDFLDEFEYNELIVSMRQKNQDFFFQLLNRIRIGMPTNDDIKLLESLKKKRIKEAAKFYFKLAQAKKATMISLF